MLIGNGKAIVEESDLVETFKGAAADMSGLQRACSLGVKFTRKILA